MIIRVRPSTGEVDLVEPDDFEAFSVRAEPGAERTAIASTLGTAVPDLDGHVWVSIDQLRRLAPASNPIWNSQLDDMLRYAATKGWLSPDELHILAHLE